MQIEYFGEGKFRIKSQKAQIVIDQETKINDFVISNSGEYEVAGIRLEVVNSIIILEVDGVVLAHLDKRKKLLSNEELELLENVDILFVPVGAGDVFDPKEALAVIKEIEPKIVIPMHYNDISNFTKLEGIKPEELDELKLKDKPSENDPRRIIILNAKNK